MSAISNLTLSLPAAIVATGLRRWMHYPREVWLGWRDRRTLDEIAALDDRMLRDISLFRGELDWLRDGPLLVDPLARLKNLSDERRGIAHQPVSRQ